MTRRPSSSAQPPQGERSVLESRLDERALHEDFKRLARLSAARPVQAQIAATVRTGELTFVAPCLEVSNEAVGLLVPPAAAPAKGAPVLLELRRGELLLMSGAPCRVESVSAVDGTELLFVVASFEPRLQLPAAPLRITSALRVRAVLEAVSSLSSAFTVGTDHGSVVHTFEAGELEGPRLHLLAPAVAGRHGRREGELVTLSFEFNGKQLFGYCFVLLAAGEALVVSLPQALLERPARTSLRIPTRIDHASIHFVSPLSALTRKRGVLGVSATGLSFEVDPADVFPPGLLLSEVLLELGTQRVHLEARVSAVGHLEFTSMPADDRQRLLELLLNHRVEGAECGSGVAFSRIWELFREEGTVWRDHALPPALGHQALGDGGHGLSKTVVLVREGELAAHSSGLRIYSRTWLAQHLLVKSGFHRAGTLSQQVMSLSFEYGEALPDVEYVRGLWRVSQQSTERIYDAVSTRLLRPGLAYRARFEPMRLPLSSTPPPGPLRVREATADDERAFLAFASATFDPLKLLSDDLVMGELHLESLARRFETLGLSRGRSLAVVEDGQGAPLGWALLETMSQGLFWAEMYSSFRIFLLEPSGRLAQQARTSLAAFAAAAAARSGRREAECHAGPADVAGLGALGFVSLGPVYEFGAHRSVIREFTTQMSAVLARIRRRDRGEPRHPGELDGPMA